jgi:hypothetical protein
LNSYGTTALNEFYGLPAFHVLDATLKGLHNVTVYNLHWKKTTDLSLTIDLHMHILVGSFVDKKLNVSDIAIGHDK